MRTKAFLLLLAVAAQLCPAQKRLVLIDQDGSGPGGSNQMAMLALLQSPQIEVLGITMVTGNAWRDEETLHTLRMLELTGHANVPVAKGAVFPLVRSEEETRLSAAIDGKVAWLGAWGQGQTMLVETAGGVTPVTPAKLQSHGPYAIPPMPEGQPSLKPIDEDAAHFLIRQVRTHPHHVTIYAAGPMTNIALAISIDPEFAALTKGIVLMGGSLNPQTDDPEFAANPRHEFNFWFDPEAAHIVLHADWPRVDVTTVDVSIKAPFTQKMLDEIAKSNSPTARYIAAWSQNRYYLWDQLAACAWLDPTLITKEKLLYMDVDLSHGRSYGDTLTWTEPFKPATGVRMVHAQVDLDLSRFHKMFVELMTGGSTPIELLFGAEDLWRHVMTQKSILEAAKLVAFVPTIDPARARTFYEDVLGLRLVEDAKPFALVFDANGTMLRVTTVHELHPDPFTVLGWDVSSIEDTVTDLTASGIEFLRFPGMNDTDPIGIWTAPSGARIAWFKDPDGNVLSVTQF